MSFLGQLGFWWDKDRCRKLADASFKVRSFAKVDNVHNQQKSGELKKDSRERRRTNKARLSD